MTQTSISPDISIESSLQLLFIYAAWVHKILSSIVKQAILSIAQTSTKNMSAISPDIAKNLSWMRISLLRFTDSGKMFDSEMLLQQPSLRSQHLNLLSWCSDISHVQDPSISEHGALTNTSDRQMHSNPIVQIISGEYS